jgi:uncharacterized protein YggE
MLAHFSPSPHAVVFTVLAFGCVPAIAGCHASPSAPTYVTSTTPTAPRSIAVTASAEIKTAPDEFTLTVGVDTSAADADAAKVANDKSMAALLDVTRAEKVDANDARTDDMTIRVRYDDSPHRIVGYDAHKSLTVVLHDGARVERILTELSKAGANRLDGVAYSSTRVVDLRKEARVMAVTAARDKAQAMAAALGQRIGHPLRIDEEPSDGGYRGQAMNVMMSNDARGTTGETMATGKLRVQSTVAVTFELID